MSTVEPYRNHYDDHRNIRKQNLSDPLGLFALLSLDLVLEILYRTPIKSLLTLNCVSKPFNSFISDPKFANDHLRLSKIHHRHHNLLISPWAFFSEGNFSLLDSRLTSVFNNNNSTTIVPDMKLNFPLNPSNIRAIIADSCDGIICLQPSMTDSTVVIRYYGTLVPPNSIYCPLWISRKVYKLHTPLGMTLNLPILTR